MSSEIGDSVHLRKLHISNFRALENIEADFDSLVSVIIGPNAIGKTTILEAVRLAKATLAPRTQGETNSTLQKMGILSPHAPQQIFPAAVTNKPERPTSIRCRFKAEETEIAEIEQIIPQLAPNLALQSIGLSFANAGQALGFLSSPHGAQAVAQAKSQLDHEMAQLKTNSYLNLNLTINFQTGTLTGEHPIQQIFYQALDQRLEPARTKFSYFPTDRALPIGETQPVMIGLQDSIQQLESYNSQPELKFNRLKQTIFNSIIAGSTGRDELNAQFKLIFEKILKGRELGPIGLSPIGSLSIKISDTDTKSTFYIDGLSSGEKGLILTFLIIARSTAEGSMILFDEPELHLNPAVCRDLIQFLVDEYALRKNMQAIICSHSAEILAATLERANCALFHLRNGTTLAKVRQQDRGEIRDALKRLGSSESEALLYKGTVSVEGLHDVEILQVGFDHIFRRYKLKERGGRGSIETDIRQLQKAETNKDEIGCHFFLFDHDGKPTSLEDTAYVKLRQLQRYCLENYLLDVEIITDLTRDKDFSDTPFNNLTDATTTIKDLAVTQLNRVVGLQVYRELGLEKIHFDVRILQEADTTKVALGLLSQIDDF